MNEVKAMATVNKKIYIHNDLDTAAFYFKERIEKRAAKNDRVGIGHEMLACLVLLAFTVEAQFNFLGYKLVKDWNERDDALSKVHTVLKQLSADNDLSKAPYKTIKELKNLRDMLAHGKPKELEWKGEVEPTKEEIDALIKPSADYEAFLKEAFVVEAHDNVDTIWKDLLKKSKIDPSDTLTRGNIVLKAIPSVK